MRSIALIISLVLIACQPACWAWSKQDGPPLIKLNLSHLTNPIPHTEPASATGNPSSYVIAGKRYFVRKTSENYHQRGIASWYGSKFHGRKTSSGEPYDMFSLTAANKTLPIPCYAQVTNLDNGKKIIVRINDRGPFHPQRIIDLSYAAAQKLGMDKNGTAHVQVDALPPFQHLGASQWAKANQQLFLQLGAFGQQQNATSYANTVEQTIHRHTSVAKTTTSFGALYRVTIGPLMNIRDAEKINQALRQAGLAKGLLTSV